MATTARTRGRGSMGSGSQGRGRLRLVPQAAGRRGRAAEGVRWSRVRAARARIAAGYYDRADVSEKLVEAVLTELARE